MMLARARLNKKKKEGRGVLFFYLRRGSAQPSPQVPLSAAECLTYLKERAQLSIPAQPARARKYVSSVVQWLLQWGWVEEEKETYGPTHGGRVFINAELGKAMQEDLRTRL